jgi:nucleoside-diphosphate-sugar epimerase
MAVLVTGATGLVDRALVDALNDPVYAASRAGAVPEGVSGDVTGVTFDLVDESTIDALPWDDVDDVVHLAAYTDPRGSVDDPHTCFQTNASGTSALLANARTADVDSFVYVSSYWVYDPSVTGKIDESTPMDVETPYGASKAAAEFQCDAFRAQYDFAVTTLRPFNVYGPGARHHQVVPEFVQQAVEDGVIEPHPGNPVRDFLYVDDLVDAIRKCVTARMDDVFNVGSGVGTSIHDLANTVADAVERHTGASVETSFSGDPEPTDEKVADVAKLRAAIDLAPGTSLSDGIDSVTSHYLKTHNVDNA